MRKTLTLVLPLAIIAAAGYAWYRSGRPKLLASVEGRLIGLPTGQGRWVAWLEHDGSESRLIAPGRYWGTRPVLAGPRLSGLAVGGRTAFVTRPKETEQSAPAAELLQVDLTGGSPEVVVDLHHPADQMAWGEGWLCWLERRESAVPAAPFLVAAEPVSVVRACRDTGGQVSTIAVLPSSSVSMGPEVDLVGVADGQVYWVERLASRRGLTTLVRRAPASGGPPITLVREEGDQTAVLLEGDLVWTAHSAEAAQPHAFAAVKRSRLDGTTARVIGDWLGNRGTLLVGDGGAYFQEPSRLWRLGAGPGSQRVQHRESRSVAQASAVSDTEYLVLWHSGGRAIASRPLTWWARVRAAVSP
jgi:hypothetical protein